MHPDLEIFLEEAFDDIQPAVPGVGRVVVEPDYDAAPAAADKEKLTNQLLELIKDHSEPGDVEVPPGMSVLAKYVRKITLKADSLDGPWVEVAPPGNWI